MATALLLWCFSVGTAFRHNNRRLEGNLKFASDQAIHPGHPAVYTSRLLRNEHIGLAALLEAEERWRRPAPTSFSETSAKAKAPSFVRMSSPLVEGLQRHQWEVAHARPLHASFLEGVHEEEDSPTAVKLSSLRTEYVGPIGVGSVDACASLAEGAEAGDKTCKTAAQSSVWVVFDTGSTNLWVNSDACTEGSCAKPDRVRYNHTASTSYNAPEPPTNLRVTFGTGKLSGPMAMDDFHVGPLTLRRQSFGMIEKMEGAIFESYPIEGILGLAFAGMAAEGTTALFENVIQQKALPNNELAFYFSLENPSANAMLWGGVDLKFNATPIEYFKVAKPFYWGLDLLNFQIDGKDMIDSSLNAPDQVWEAIIDTGTTYWTAPTQIFNAIMAKLPAKKCSKMTDQSHPPIMFRLENAIGEPRDFELKNNQYMVSSGIGDDAWCNAAFMKLDMRSGHEKSMIFGEVFMRQYFTVFDRADGDPSNAQVGFAVAAQGEEIDNHLKSITKDQPTFADVHQETEGLPVA